jgi:tRNA(fMet)-specific endonuclease VapC
MIRLFMLDTNTVSYILKGKSPAARLKLAALPPEEVACISSITEAELHYGLARSRAGEQRQQALNWFLARLQVLPFGSEQALVYGKLRARQEAIGKPLGPLDTQIAAHAVSIGAILITSDKAFQHVPDLPGLENWATDL